ncbi:hypothetical protein SHAL103562_17030 [Shewanella algae]|nr:hypothetical protein TUM3811_30780 [Shewanella algae]
MHAVAPKEYQVQPGKVVFHTCQLRGCTATTLKNAPFKSRANQAPHWQWLSQGYYFWTADYFAHKWGRDSIRGDYAIVGCEVKFGEGDLLDLVSEFEHQIWLSKMLDMYVAELSKSYNDIGKKQTVKPTVCQVIEHYRKKNLFPFIAIKADDNYHKKNVKFVPDKNASLFLVRRQQICLFEEGYDRIIGKALVHPVS